MCILAVLFRAVLLPSGINSANTLQVNQVVKELCVLHQVVNALCLVCCLSHKDRKGVNEGGGEGVGRSGKEKRRGSMEKRKGWKRGALRLRGGRVQFSGGLQRFLFRGQPTQTLCVARLVFPRGKPVVVDKQQHTK